MTERVRQQHAMSIADLSEELDRKRVSPVDLARQALERATVLNGTYNVFITICEERALRMAQAAEERAQAGARLGPLDGIPITIKDLLAMNGVPTTNGAGAGWEAPTTISAEVVANLERAGAVIIGKTNLHELGMGITNDNPHFGPTRNPWDLARSPGGSSGGSSAALALGIGLGSVGTDTGGSIRIPAAHCGVFGLKPSFGRLPTDGVSGIAWSLDHVGLLASRAQDLAPLYHAMMGGGTGRDHELRPGNLRGLRVGVPTTYYTERIEPGVAAAYRVALGALEGLGAILVEITMPPMDDVVPLAFTLSQAEASYMHRERFRAHPGGLGKDVRSFLESGYCLEAVAYIAAVIGQRDFRCAMEALIAQVDVIAAPTTPATPKPFADESVVIDGVTEPMFECMIRFTSVFNVSGHPVLAAPCPIQSEGLPVGFQLAAAMGREDSLLRIAMVYQDAALGDHFARLAALRERAGAVE